jgi:hypothetical protein
MEGACFPLGCSLRSISPSTGESKLPAHESFPNATLTSLGRILCTGVLQFPVLGSATKHYSAWGRCAFEDVLVAGYPSLTAALLARRRIDFMPRSHRLHYHGIAGAIACRTFLRISWWLSHLSVLFQLAASFMSGLGIVTRPCCPVVPSEFWRMTRTPVYYGTLS